MKKHAIKHWPLWAILLFVIGGVSLGTALRSHQVDAATNPAGLELSDQGCGNNMNASAPFYASALDTWSSWAGDSDRYDPDCMNIKAASSIPIDIDVRVALQARDINTPCGLFWLFKCGDGGGTIIYTPWASASNAGWSTTWVSDADQWDPDQWRIKIETQPWYGHTVNDFKFGLQLANEISNNAPGCTNAGTIVYSASSTAPAFSSWANDGGTMAPSFNCARVKLLTSPSLNNPTASLTGTTTVQNGDTVNIPWDVEYINTSTGCTLVGRNSGGTIIDNKGTVTTANGAGSVTSGIPITVATTYTLFCNGFNGTTVSTTKTITPFAGTPPTLSFTMNPTSVAPGDTSTATISVENTTAGTLSCTLVGKDLSGATVDSGYTYIVPAPSAVVDTYTDNGWSGPLYKTTEGSQSWVVPSDWSNNNQIEVVGGGGGGANGASGKGGGGGGAYSKILDTTALSAGGTVTISVGANGAASAAGGDTYVCSSTSNCASIAGTAVIVGAKGGAAGSTGTAAGGQAASGVGTTKYSGGTGGNSDQYGGAGGGGGGGPNGNGKNGGYTNRNEGSGGGGNGGGGNGYDANAYGGCFAGCGGIGGYRYGGSFVNCKGTGTGSGGGGCMGDGTRGGLGANGGGGGGGDDDGSGWRGGYGGNGTDIGGSIGSGGGGGGGGQYSSTGNVGGNGGLYGGGGGGASGTSAGGVGGQGIIIYQYEKIAHTTNLADNTDVHTSTHTVNITTDYTVTCTGIPAQTVRVSLVGGACYLDGVTITNGGSATFYQTESPGSGNFCSEYDGIRGCTNGALTGTASYQYASCVDQDAVRITANNATPLAAVRKGTDVAVAWYGGNADSCTVTGTNGFNAVSPITGLTDITATSSIAVTQKTVFTATCTKGTHTSTAQVTVNILPTVIEI